MKNELPDEMEQLHEENWIQVYTLLHPYILILYIYINKYSAGLKLRMWSWKPGWANSEKFRGPD